MTMTPAMASPAQPGHDQKLSGDGTSTWLQSSIRGQDAYAQIPVHGTLAEAEHAKNLQTTPSHKGAGGSQRVSMCR